MPQLDPYILMFNIIGTISLFWVLYFLVRGYFSKPTISEKKVYKFMRLELNEAIEYIRQVSRITNNYYVLKQEVNLFLLNNLNTTKAWIVYKISNFIKIYNNLWSHSLSFFLKNLEI